MDAAGRAEKEFGAHIAVIKKTSAAYTVDESPLPCPSVLVNDRLIARNATVTYTGLKTAILSDSPVSAPR